MVISVRMMICVRSATPDAPGSPDGPPCLCERKENGDKDHDNCCDFDERSEAEESDPEKGCECCVLDEVWRKAKGCVLLFHWDRVWGQGPKITEDLPSSSVTEPPLPPTECPAQSPCTGQGEWQAQPRDLETERIGFKWVRIGTRNCSAGCESCPPISTPAAGQTVVTPPCVRGACTNGPHKLPQGLPVDQWTFKFPISQVTNNVIPDQDVVVPVTVEGWRMWMFRLRGSNDLASTFGNLDDLRQWFRLAATWVMGVMIAGIMFKEFKL